MKKTIGIIGCGNMGSAIARGLKSKYSLYVFDQDKNKTKDIRGIKAADSLSDLANRADILLLAVKPQDFDGVLAQLKDKTAGKLIISIAAGISTEYIRKASGGARVVRAMPNIGLKIGRSVTCLCAGESAGVDDLVFARDIFSGLGKVREIKEEMMNAATAVSGSGPGFEFEFCDSEGITADTMTEKVKEKFIRSLAEAARDCGFNKEDAVFLAAATTDSTIALMRKTGLAPRELMRQVASKGGTTEAGLAVLEEGGSLKEAVKAALKRAEELAKKT